MCNSRRPTNAIHNARARCTHHTRSMRCVNSKAWYTFATFIYSKQKQTRVLYYSVNMCKLRQCKSSAHALFMHACVLIYIPSVWCLHARAHCRWWSNTIPKKVLRPKPRIIGYTQQSRSPIDQRQIYRDRALWCDLCQDFVLMRRVWLWLYKYSIGWK